MQAMLDRYSTGIEVMSVAIQNAQPPQQVQAAFNDAVKAGQDRERQINLGEAYMNAVIPKAQGTASRLKEEAEGYKARVVETARGDADRFTSVYTEYAKAPQVTRDRIYVDAMRDIYQNVTKVYVDQKSGSSSICRSTRSLRPRRPRRSPKQIQPCLQVRQLLRALRRPILPAPIRLDRRPIPPISIRVK